VANAANEKASPEANLFPHGGARRRPAEGSWLLSERQCLNMLGGAHKALEIGRPLNRWITILWARGGLEDYDGVKATGAFFKRFGDWMRRHGERACWIYSHERGEINGVHVHLLLHVPERLDGAFRKMPRRWVGAILPRGYVVDAVESKKLKGGNSPDEHIRELYRVRMLAKLHYMMKETDPRTKARLGIPENLSGDDFPMSPVFGKRSGCWQGWRN